MNKRSMNKRGTIPAAGPVSSDAAVHCPVPMKRSLIAIVLAVSAIVAACGDGGSAPPVTDASATATETTEVAAATESPATTTQAAATTAANGDEVAPSGVDGPQAPDFEFQLDDGSTFVLSEEAMPVYMVFWAEW